MCGCGYCAEVALSVVGSFLLWSNLYNLLQIINHKCPPEWNCRMIAGCHGFVSAFLCYCSALLFGPWPPHHIGYPLNQLHCSIIVLSFGYFLFDLIWCLYMQTEGIVMLAHHILSLYGFFHVLYFNLYGCEIIAILGASEFTNPILQLRWFMKRLDYYKGSLAAFIDWSFVLFFVGARVLLGTVYFIWVQSSPRVDLIAKAGGAMMYGVGVIFSCHLMKFIHRKYIKKKPNKDD